jgi:ABC-type Fe3+/spermidine/putrescine transport system ATPase subunit
MLELMDVYKSYEGRALLDGISFSVGAGETVCLLGASGSGKSTLLRMIAGLETADRGEICWQGVDLAPTPAHRRGFGLVFQDFALFPHLNVEGNVAFGLEMKNVSAGEMGKRVARALERVNLAGFAKRRVGELSGGEQQRVALARALAPDPKLLLFDEPLGALDRALKDRLLDELRGILHGSGIPAVYVTHDQQEATAIADRLLLLHDGRIVREGMPADVWRDPRSGWAARFLGLGNVLEGKALEGRRVQTDVGILETACETGAGPGEPVAVLIRPDAHRVAGENILGGRVTDILFQHNQYRVTIAGGLFFMLADAPQVGQEIEVRIPREGVECLMS